MQKGVGKACGPVMLAALAGVSFSSAWAQHAELSAPQEHVALVIGNGQVKGPLALTQPAADAAAIAERLRLRGFLLVAPAPNGGCAEGPPQVDVDREAMHAAVACFAKAARGARQALFYFSGHSLIVEGRNYLVPAGIAITSSSGANELVELGAILESLEQAKVGLSIVVLDAARSSMKDVVKSNPGLSRVTATRSSRIVAYSAPVGAWAETGTSAEQRNTKGAERVRAEESLGRSHPGHDGDSSADASLSPYTRRLVSLLDDDLDGRSLDQPGLNVRAVFTSASSSGAASSANGEVTVENVSGMDMLGRLPKIGKSVCDILGWRAAHLGRCIEVAAAYEQCGRDASMRERLQSQCPDDWAMVMRYSLRASLAGVMKAKKCQPLNEVIAKFASEPAAANLDEFKELQSLTQYTCALEAKEKLKSDLSAVMSTRDCEKAHRLLVEHRDAIDAETRVKVERLSKEVCCPEYGLGKECLTRKALIARAIGRLEQKGCSTGSSPDAKAARAMHLMRRLNDEEKLGINLSANGTPVDRIWTRLETLAKDACSCQTNEVVSGSGTCTCQLYRVSASARCLDRESAVRLLQERLQALGCNISSVDGKIDDKLRRVIARLPTFDRAFGGKELTPANFAVIEKLSQDKSKLDSKRLCADYVVESGLNREQRRILERKQTDLQDQPYSALAVASKCSSPANCAWSIVTGEPDAELARNKALSACQQKAKACTLAASHRAAR